MIHQSQQRVSSYEFFQPAELHRELSGKAISMQRYESKEEIVGKMGWIEP